MAKASFARKSLRLMFWVVVAALVLMFSIILLFRFVNPPTSAFMLGYQMGDAREPLQHEWVPISEVSEWMALAVIASEDQRFPEHHGVDFKAVHKAVSEYQAGEGLRGASTITQQTAKNLFLWNDQGIVSCVEASTGKVRWNERAVRSGKFFSSPIVANGLIYCIDSNGKMIVMRGDGKFGVLAVNDLNQPCSSTPAIANKVMYIRTYTHLVAIAK